MKGLMVILTAIIIIGAATADLVYLDKTFGKMQAEAETMLVMIEKDTEHIDSAENLAKALEIEELFHKNSRKFQALVHQILINDLAFKVVALTAHVKTNDHKMAVTDAMQVIENCRLLKDFSRPHLTNVL